MLLNSFISLVTQDATGAHGYNVIFTTVNCGVLQRFAMASMSRLDQFFNRAAMMRGYKLAICT